MYRTRNFLEALVVIMGYTSIHFSSQQQRRLESQLNTTPPTSPFKMKSSSTKCIRNVPDFIIGGTPKSGTTALATMLLLHPNITLVQKKKQTTTRKLESKESSSSSMTTESSSTTLKNNNTNSTFKTFDIVPNFLYKSQKIYCKTPKVIVVLRDPIKRLLSSYKNRNSSQQSLDNEILDDMWVMHSSGIRAGNYTNHTWKRYIQTSTTGEIGKGLYDIQLYQFSINNNNNQQEQQEENLLALSLDEMKADLNTSFAKVLDFLKLPPYNLPHGVFVAVNDTAPPLLSMHIRRRLENFYRPHNERLAQRLGSNFDFNNNNAA